MAGGTMQHPVVLDEATAARLGYGSSCVLAPADAVRAAQRWGEDGVGDGRRRRCSWPPPAGGGGGGAAAAAGSDEDGRGASATTLPEVGGCFRMWSDYRMALEGHASGVQVGTLLPPVLDMARTVADTFRRRWAAGGQYPERVLARVRLVERENSRAGGGGDDGGGGGGDEAGSPSEAAAAASEMGLDEMGADPRAREAGTKRDDERRRREAAESGPPGEGRREGAGSRREGDGGGGDVREGERRQRDDDDGGEHAGLRQVLSRLDGLDSGALVERALEDHLQGDGGEKADDIGGGAAGASGSPPPGGDQSNSSGRRRASGMGGGSVGDKPEGASAGVDAGVLSAALDGSLTAAAGPEDPRDDEAVDVAAAAVVASTLTGLQDEDASSESGGGAAAAAVAASAGIQTPAEDKFMLPGWHYLALSGRALSMDFRWNDMDLVLMQDPTARQGRDTGKNVLALRSSGALTVSSSGVGESVDVQLRDASLLPCFYADEAGEEGDFSSAASKRTTSGSGGGPAQRLALILGGGESALAAVARTWLGQGLVTAHSRPLLEPFTMQFGYGTVVARSAAEGRGTDVTDGRRRRRSSALSRYDDSEEDEKDAEEEGGGDGGGLVVPSPAARKQEGAGDDVWSMHEDSSAEKAERHGLVDQSAGGDDVVSGVFRVAVSEVQLLGAGRNANEAATVEIMVRILALCLPRRRRFFWLAGCLP